MAPISSDIYFGTDADAVSNRLASGRRFGCQRLCRLSRTFALLINYWLEDPAGSVPYAGVNDDNIVDLVDYALLANDWMLPANPDLQRQHLRHFFPARLSQKASHITGALTLSKAGQRRKGDLWSFTVPNWDANSTLIGKVMAGYQAWFNAPGDGTSRGWVHWGNGTFAYGSANIDWWPDMTEYDCRRKIPRLWFLRRHQSLRLQLP